MRTVLLQLLWSSWISFGAGADHRRRPRWTRSIDHSGQLHNETTDHTFSPASLSLTVITWRTIDAACGRRSNISNLTCMTRDTLLVLRTLNDHSGLLKPIEGHFIFLYTYLQGKSLVYIRTDIIAVQNWDMIFSSRANTTFLTYDHWMTNNHSNRVQKIVNDILRLFVFWKSEKSSWLKSVKRGSHLSWKCRK